MKTEIMRQVSESFKPEALILKDINNGLSKTGDRLG